MNAPEMFLPKDLTTDEEQLLQTVTSQLLAHRSPTGSGEETAVRHEAAQVAAELIWEARAPQQETGTSQELDNAEDEERLSNSGYHQRLRGRLAQDQALHDLEVAAMDRRERDNDPDG